MVDIRQSTNYAKYLKSQGWIVERVGGINYFFKKIPFFGSILKIQRPKQIKFATIKILEKKYRVFQTIIEPNLPLIIPTIFTHNQLLHQGYKLSKSPFLPSKTIHLELTQSKDQIFNNFSKDAKYSIRKGEGLIIKEYSSPKEIELFHTAWKKSVNFNRYVPSLQSLLNIKKSFPHSKSIFLASHNNTGNIIGGALFTQSSHDFGYNKVSSYAYYWYGFTNNEGRTSLSQYSLLYSGILWAKKNNCNIFDFEGIYDDRLPQSSWLGFTHFKKSFGGTEILYPGCYTKLSLLNSLGLTW